MLKNILNRLFSLFQSCESYDMEFYAVFWLEPTYLMLME